jgi:hypothetical protein
MDSIKAAVERLSTYFYNQLRPYVSLPAGHQDFEQVKLFIDTLRKEGFTGKEIGSRIDHVKTTIKKGASPFEVEQLFNTSERLNKKYNKNLIEPGKQYLHTELKILPDIPKVYYDEDLEEFVTEYDNKDPQIKERYTLDDIIDYFYAQFHLPRKDINRDRAMMYYVLSESDVDEVLFTILALVGSGQRIYNIIELNNDSYRREGHEERMRIYEIITNKAQESGGLAWFQMDLS